MTTTPFPYLHGFSKDEQARLYRQARFAEYSIYQDVDFTGAEKVLEVGCGVGAQTEILLRRFPDLSVHGIDLNDNQLQAAREYLLKHAEFSERYEIEKMDAGQMGFSEKAFDGAFLCFVLEHVPDPSQVLAEVRRVLQPRSRVFITEVMNSTFFLDPYSPHTWKYWMAYNDYQVDQSGDPFVGVKLGNLLQQQGYSDIQTTIKTWHFDNRKPAGRKEVISFWSDLLLSAADQLLRDKYVSEETVSGMKEELQRVAFDKNAVFFFSFMQAQARV